MSASVQRRIVRNIREYETGRRNPPGHGRHRGADPALRALKQATDKAAYYKALDEQKRRRGIQ